MIRKVDLRYVAMSCYNGRGKMDFGADCRDGSVKTRRVTGPSTRFSNIIGDLNGRLMHGRAISVLHATGWTIFFHRVRRRA